MIRSIGILALAFGVLFLVGCGGGSPGTYDLAFKLDESLRDPASNRFPPIRADLIGVGNQSGKEQLGAVNLTEHFGKSDASRAGEGFKSLALGTGEGTLMADDPAWAKWNAPRFLVVFVDIPGKGGEGGKPTDPRRLVFSLNKERWSGAEGVLRFSITRDRVVLLTNEKVPKEVGPDGF